MKLLPTALLILLLAVLSGCAQPIQQEAKTIFYPPPPSQPRIQYLYTLTKQSDIGKEQTSFEQYLLGPEVEFTGVVRPYDISTGKGKIYVIDRMYDKIFIFDLQKQQLNTLEDNSHPDGLVRYGSGIWVDTDGTKYIADIKRKQILVFDVNDKYKGAYGDETIFDKPVDVAVYDNKIYVCDYTKHQILVLDKESGQLIQTIGEPGTEDHQLQRPTHVTVDEQGTVYVTDAFNFKIKRFTPDGTFDLAIGTAGDTIGTFARPKGIAVDRQGNIYAVDAANEQVQVFNSAGQLLMFFGGPGTNIENLWLPAGISIDYANVNYFQNFADQDFKLEYLIYVANMAGPGRTNVYGYGQWTGDSRRLDRMNAERQVEEKKNQVQEPE
ncbi:MAG: 6-bladed beta-propeller [Desulfocapsa sp.]|nr:6-bladed beta-propeller [Desulfocapsa sp.]